MTFCATFSDVMDEIVLAATDDLPGPPAPLLSLMLTCRKFHSLLEPTTNATLYSRLFRQKFDAGAIARRFSSNSVDASSLALELQQRFMMLRRIKRRQVDGPDVRDAFLTAYIMLAEDDGKNIAQLRWAGLSDFVTDYIRLHLHDGAVDGWPAENATTTLAVALFWQLTTRSALTAECDEVRKEISALLAPYALVGFRYPMVRPDLDRRPASRGPPTDNASPEHDVVLNTVYLGQSLALRLPPIGVYAIPSYIARLERSLLCVPLGTPNTRQEAIAHGVTGFTRMDVEEYNTQFVTRLHPSSAVGCMSSTSPRSERHDMDWSWITRRPCPDMQCGYKLGTLSGKWLGTLQLPFPHEYAFLEANGWNTSPLSNTVLMKRPLYCNLQEHYRSCESPGLSLALGLHKFLEGGPLPEGGITVQDAKSPSEVFYRTWDEDGDAIVDGPEPGSSESPACDLDVILTGTTDARHGQAWGAYQFFGGIRMRDGLVVLLRESGQQTEGGAANMRSLFIGYVLSSQNLVGRWRRVERVPAVEGIWALSKKE
ncbi:hypothetical protein EWM64_g7824 [Hericium alpestre]|uniref:F-box domain-containing protein n=1 Tax=Hericium alpestre TaxID=135208 RepID=A0A4Y9ZRQ7_9AGAM|nr:hypothetical protein EWM64_g7824 [Hericium alpestre]